jgi:hypothetical protein
MVENDEEIFSESIVHKAMIVVLILIFVILIVIVSDVKCSFSRIRINELAIIILESFKIHTLRFCRAFRKRLRRIFNTSNLKSSLVQSTKFSLNCSHNVSSFKSFRSYEVIVVCTKMFLSILRTKVSTFSDSESEK